MKRVIRVNLDRRWLLPVVVALIFASFAGGSPGSAFTTVPLSPTAQGGEGSSDSGGEVTVELPPPDLPTTNEQGYTYDLRATLKADLDAVPREAPVYELRRKQATLEQAEKLAEKLEINGDVTDRGDGTFEASGDGQLYFSTELTQYFSPNPGSDGKLPEDEDAIAFAKECLRVTWLLPPYLGEGEVASRIDET